MAGRSYWLGLGLGVTVTVALNGKPHIAPSENYNAVHASAAFLQRLFHVLS